MGCLALVLLGPISCSGSCLARPYLMSFESELGRDPLSHIVRKLISRRARVKGKPLLSYEEERSVPLGKIVYSVPSPYHPLKGKPFRGSITATQTITRKTTILARRLLTETIHTGHTSSVHLYWQPLSNWRPKRHKLTNSFKPIRCPLMLS